MTWLTWRQHRAQLITTAGLLIALGVLLLVSGREAAAYIAEHAPAGCPGPDLACGDLNAAIAERYNAIYTVYGWLPIGAPALIGAFWGAPLLGKEFERGTNKLAWTQAVSLRRWLGVKLALLAVAVMLGGLALSAMVSAWRPIFGDRGSFGNLGDFNMLGVAPAAWWLFAFMVGTAAGAVLRRTLPAMAVVVAVVSVVTFGLFSLSDHYAEPPGWSPPMPPRPTPATSAWSARHGSTRPAPRWARRRRARAPAARMWAAPTRCRKPTSGAWWTRATGTSCTCTAPSSSGASNGRMRRSCSPDRCCSPA